MHEKMAQESFSQPEKGYRFSQDPFLLAGMVEKSDKPCLVIDIGTGNGVILSLLKKIIPNGVFIGIDIRSRPLVYAKRNFPKANFVQADAKTADSLFKNRKADIVISNPPFWKAGSGRVNKNRDVALSRHEIKLTLSELVSTASNLLADGGMFHLCHLPSRMEEVIKTLQEHSLTPDRVRGVAGIKGKEEYLFLISATKNGQTDLKQLPMLTVFDQNRSYTDEVREIYRKFE